MEKKIVCILVCMLMCATVFSVTGNENINDTNGMNTIISMKTTSRDPGDVLVDFDMQSQTIQQHLGSEWDGQYYWSTACGSTSGGGNAPPYNIYKFDSTGVLAGTYPQPSSITSGWGMRDMAFDGTYLYSGAETGFWKIDPADGSTTLMFSSIAPMTIIRALAWVPSEGMFYTGSFALGWYKFTPDGSQKIAVTNPGLSGVYGMAYDEVNDTIWVFDQGSGGTETKFYEYDYQSGALTGNTWVVPLLSGLTAQIAGGCFYASDCISGKAVLGGCVQGTPDDKMFVMELGITNLPPDTPGAPSGPNSGVTGVEYTFTATTSDPEGDPIEYWFEFGDGENSGWVSPGSANHAWTSEGTYDVTVKARDAVHGGESAFSPAHSIEILGGPMLEISAVKSGTKIKVVIENNGGADAPAVDYTITLEGGAIIGKSSNGTTSVASGGSSEVTSGLIIGFGKTKVTVTATCPESDVTVTRNGFVIFFFTYVRAGG